MVAGSDLSWQGIKRKAVYTEGAGPVCKCTGQCTLPFFNPCQVHKFLHMGKFMHLIRPSTKRGKSQGPLPRQVA